MENLPQVQTTKDYSRFKLMAGNRAVDYNQVKRMKREMERNPHLFAGNPILVNENDFIIDGQHRRQAAQELGRPIYYIVVPGITLEETRALNVTQKHWTLMDFARSYADSGQESYIKFILAVNKYPNLAPAIIMKVLAGGQLHRLSENFRHGTFEIESYSQAMTYLEKIDRVRKKGEIIMNSPMAMSLLRLLKNEDIPGADEPFDYDRFMFKLERKGAREIFVPGNNIRNCLRAIEDVYNFHSPVRVRLY